MANRIDTQARIEAVRFQNQTGSPAAPAAGYSLLYLTTNGLYMETSSGAVIGPFVTGTAAAGGRTLIQQLTPTGTTTASFTSIPATYTKLILEYAVRGETNAASVSMDITLNNDTTDANYRRQLLTAYQGGTVAGASGDDNVINDAVLALTAPASEASYGIIEIPFYARTNFFKSIMSRHGHRRDTSAVQMQIDYRIIDWENTTAVNRVDLILAAGNFAAGSILRLYGDI